MERYILFDPDTQGIVIVTADGGAEGIRNALGCPYKVTEHTLNGHPYRVASDSASILKALSPSALTSKGVVCLTGRVLILGRADRNLEAGESGLEREEISYIVNHCFWNASISGNPGDLIMVLGTED